MTLSAVLALAIAPGQPAQAKSDRAARQLDFANGLFLRKLYDMAAQEYAAYVKAFPGDATEEYARFQWAESLYNLQHYVKISVTSSTHMQTHQAILLFHHFNTVFVLSDTAGKVSAVPG